MRKKEWGLVRLLRESQDTFLTSQFLSRQLSLSEKTVRNMIKHLNDSHATVLAIQGVTGQGYQLTITNPEAFAAFYQEIGSDRMDLNSSDDRERYILRHLFFEQEELTVPKLQERLFISSSTISKLLNVARSRLKDYQLELKRYKDILSVVGEEADKRRFIRDYFLSSSETSPLFGYQAVAQLFEDVDVQALYRSVLEVSREAGLELSDFALTNLLVHLSLAVKRLKVGYQLEKVQFDSGELHQQTEAISRNIIDRIATYTGLELPVEEAAYMTLHLLGKGRTSLDASPVIGQESELMACLTKCAHLLGVRLDSQDELLLQGLQAHFEPLLLRLKNKISLDNPLYEEIASQYGDLLEKTQEAFEDFSLLKGYTVSPHEWAYIALHLLAAIERQSQQVRKRVLLVCATGFGSAQVLCNRIEHHFGTRLEIVDCVSVHELEQYDFSQVDGLISALALSQYLYPKPVIEVSVLVNEADIRQIESWLGGVVALTDRQGQLDQAGLQTALEECLSEERFFYLTQPQTRESVLSCLVESLSAGQDRDFQEQMKLQIQAREELGSLVFSELVAVPHPALSLATREEVAVAICQEPLVWKEAKTIRIVLLISPSKWQNPHLQHLSKAIATFTQNRLAQETLLEDPRLSTFKTVLIQSKH